MFIVLLTFSNRAGASPFMKAHNEWLARGFDDGVFLLSGSLQPGVGGGILAQAASRETLQTRIGEDPFVTEGIVTADILEIAVSRADPRLEFLQG